MGSDWRQDWERGHATGERRSPAPVALPAAQPALRRASASSLDFAAQATRGEALAALRRAFLEAGLDTPVLDGRILACAALSADAAEITARPDALLGPTAAARLTDFARRRLAREPVARILGCREFWGLTFELSPETLEPRPDTETVVESALAVIRHPSAPLRILDLGTGSGCLLIVLLHELAQATGVGIDRSRGALATARRNACRHGVDARTQFVVADWAAAVRGRFDLVVANPPYIPSGELPELAPEVREHDPAAALDGGPDGLAAYRIIFAQVPALLDTRGALVVEIGVNQEGLVKDLAAAAGLTVADVAVDLAGHPRAVVARRSQS